MAADRILMVTRNLPPLVGGMEHLMAEVLRRLQSVAPVDLIGPQGAAATAPPGCRVLAEIPFGAARFLPGATLQVLRHADPRRHRLCLGGSGLMAPALRAARTRGLRTAVYLHGLDVIHPAWLYQRGFVPVLATLDRIVCNSHYTRGEALARGLPAERCVVVNPGVAMPEPVVPRDADGAGPLLLCVGRLIARKGVAEFITQALPALRMRYHQLRLVVVGTEPPAGRGEQLARIRAAIAQAGMEAAVELRGRVTDAELAALYAAADLHLLPLVPVPGDVEGFGMVILEAAARGVPTVAFDLGGIADALHPQFGGARVASGDYPALISAIGQCLEAASSGRRAELVEATRARSWDAFGRELVGALGLA